MKAPRLTFANLKNAGILLFVIWLSITAYANFGPSPQPDYVAPYTRVDTVYVTPKDIEQNEPDAKVGRIESLAMPKVRPDYVAIAKGGADSLVNAFCKRDYDSSIVPDSAQVVLWDTAPSLNSPLLLRSVRTDSRLFPWNRSSMIAVGVQGNGDLSERRYQVTQGWQARADGDSLVVQNPRIPLKPLLGTGCIAGVAYGLGSQDVRVVAGGAALCVIGGIL